MEVHNAVLVNLQGGLGGFCGPLMLGALVSPILVRLGGSDLLIGMLSTLGFAISIPGMILGARVGIRTRRRVVTALIFNLLSAWAFLPALLVLMRGPDALRPFVAALALAAVAGGLCGSVASVAHPDIFSRVIAPDRRGRVMGIAGLFSGATGLAGGVCLSFLLGRSAFPGNYAAAGMLGLIAASISYALYLGYRELPGEKARPGAGALRLRESFREIRGDRRFLRVLQATALKFAFNAVTIFLVPTALRRHGQGDAFVGHYAILTCAVSLGMGPLQGWAADRLGIGLTACFGGLVAAAGMLAFPHAGSEVALLTASGLTLIGASAIGIMFYLAPMQLSPPEHRASYIAARYLTESASGLICTPLAGWAITMFNPAWAFSAGAAAAVASGLLLRLATGSRNHP